MSYACAICNRAFKSKDSLKKHMNRKIPCLIVEPANTQNDNKFKCESCNRCFTSNQNLKKHILTVCPIIKNKKTEVQIMKDEIIELKNAMNELKKNINGNAAINGNNNNIAINSNNTNNTTNNTQNIIINITPFSWTKLTEKCIIDLFLDESTSACEYSKMELMDKADQRKERTKNLIKLLFLESFEKSFSDDITNVNVYLAEDTAKIYQENKKWLPKSVMSVLKKEFDIFIKKCNDISGHINYPDNTPIGYQNSINQAISILRSMHDNEIIKDAKPEFNIILEANRDRLKNENII